MNATRLSVKIALALTIVATQAVAAPAAARMVAVPDPDAGRPQVTINWGDGSTASFQPYGRNVQGGANLAGGDVDGDGRAEIVVAPDVGVRAPVSVFSRDSTSGQITQLASFFPYGQRFMGGVFVGVADVTGDGLAEIITAPGAGPQPLVVDTGTGDDLVSFFAYGPSFRGGVRVAAGDVNGDGFADIITAPAGFILPSGQLRQPLAGGSPEVRVFGLLGNILTSFPAVDRPFRGGLWVAAADFNNDGKDDIAAGIGPGGPPVVRVFSNLEDTDMVQTVMPYRERFLGGVGVAAGDVSGDGLPDLVTAPGPGMRPVVRAFTRDAGGPSSFLAFDPSYRGGVSVATGDVNADGREDILASTEYRLLVPAVQK
jgi:hypothetical protein